MKMNKRYIRLKRINVDGYGSFGIHYLKLGDFRKFTSRRRYQSTLDYQLLFEENQEVRVVWPNHVISLERIHFDNKVYTCRGYNDVPYISRMLQGIEARVYDFEKLKFLESDLMHLYHIRIK